MAIRRALLVALAVEDRTRSAEQRAADAEAQATQAQQRLDLSERRRGDMAAQLQSLHMARLRGRHHIVDALQNLAGRGHMEEAIRVISFDIDEYLTSEGGDGWAVEITLAGMLDVHRYNVHTWWTTELLKRLVHEKFNLAPLVQEPTALLFMHCGMIMEDGASLGSYDLHDPAHEDESPIIYISLVP